MDREHRSLKTNERLISSLVEKSQKGDTEAFARLYDLFFDPLYRYLFYRADGDSVEDMLETVFLKIWMNLPKYRVRETPFSAWAFRIAHNVLVDSYRTNRSTDEISENHADHRPEYSSTHLVRQKLQKETLRKALSKLKSEYQQIILLKFINDFSNEEISQILGKNGNSLRILQFRALKNLRKVLESMGISEFDE